jgi:hypothetical protein
MAARIVNLRTRRKQKARAEKREKTAEVAPGVSRLERARAEAENRLLRDRLEGHRRDDPGPDGPAPDEG